MCVRSRLHIHELVCISPRLDVGEVCGCVCVYACAQACVYVCVLTRKLGLCVCVYVCACG